MHTSLSQGIGKRGNGDKSVHGRVEDMNARSRVHSHNDTGAVFTVVNRFNQIGIEFSQSGLRQSQTRYAVVGELSRTGFKSSPSVTCDGVSLSWDEVAALIGIHSHSLMRVVRKFAQRQTYTEGKSSRDRYGDRVGRERKRDRATRLSKSIRIC
ncbi:MAG TPA: hypothetical protein V6D33_12430 [Cyanophyceae cyanobacterium]